MATLTLKRPMVVKQPEVVEQDTAKKRSVPGTEKPTSTAPKIFGQYKGHIEFLYDWWKYDRETKQNKLIQKDVLGKRNFEMKIAQKGNDVKFTMKTENEAHEKRKKNGKNPIVFTKCQSIFAKLVKTITRKVDGTTSERYVLNGIYVTKPPVWQTSHLIGCRINIEGKTNSYKDKKTGEEKTKTVYELTDGEYWTNAGEKSKGGKIIFEGGKKKFKKKKDENKDKNKTV